MLCGDGWREWVGGVDLFHLLTVEKFESVLEDGQLRPRSAGVSNDYSRNTLVQERSAVVLDGSVSLSDCVPFYLHPLQPMFVDLRRKSLLKPQAVIALGFRLDSEGSNWMYSTNPVYKGARSIESSADLECHPSVYSCWGWRKAGLPHQLNEERMIERQGEALFLGSVELDQVAVVVGLAAGRVAKALRERLSTDVIVWETDLTVFPPPCAHG